MRRRPGIVSIVAMGWLASCSGAPPATDDAKALADIEQQIAKTLLEGDREGYSALLAPDWSVIEVRGRVLTKEQVMEEIFGSKERKIDAATIDDVKVRLFGDMAVVTGRTTISGSYQGTSAALVLRFTDVFSRREGRWQVVASQGTPVAE